MKDKTMTYHIESKIDGVWDRSHVEESADANTFETETKARLAIDHLTALGDDWAAGIYRVVED